MADNPNFNRGVGALSTSRFDFENHLQGKAAPDSSGSHYKASFRHLASQIDVDNPSLVYGAPSNVEQALENIKNFIDILSNIGEGFTTVGDGYDAWHDADGNINFDPAVPTLDSYLNPIFTNIINDGYIPTEFERVRRGGIILVKSGTYVIANTIEVPPGITIMGEGFGTKFVNISSLDIPAIGIEPTPKVVGTPTPMFRILSDLNRPIHDEPVDPNLFMFTRVTRFINCVICDNFLENPILGAQYYKLPQNTTGNNPLIIQESGSNLELINVSLLGRATFNFGTVVNEASRFAVQLDVTTPITTGTILKINSCFIDGFSQPIEFLSIGGTNDILEIQNSKIRAHGYLNADATANSNNCIINMNDNNATLVGNYLYGNHALFKSILNINAIIASTPNVQARSKILISANDYAIDKTSATNITPTIVTIDSSILSNIDTRATILAYGNSFQNSYGFSVVAKNLNVFTSNLNETIIGPTNASHDFTVQDVDGYILNATAERIYLAKGIKHKTVTVTTATYTIDGSASDYTIFVDTSSLEISITLPPHDNGRKIVIKDIGFNSSENNITLIRNGGTGSIEDYEGDRILATNGACWTLMSNGTSWFFI